MSDRTNPSLPKIYIARTGDKFPPFKYDPTATPDMLEVNTTRRNGQVETVRRVLQPTMVRQLIRPLMLPALFLVRILKCLVYPLHFCSKALLTGPSRRSLIC